MKLFLDNVREAPDGWTPRGPVAGACRRSREIIINAVIHRDLSNPGGYVAIAVFNDTSTSIASVASP